MKKVLVVDDDVERHVGFLRRLRKHTVVSVGTYREAIEALERGSPYDVIFLDHDLGERRTGFDVAKYLVQEIDRELWPERVIVHSHNPVGALRIRDLLRDAGMEVQLRPYGLL